MLGKKVQNLDVKKGETISSLLKQFELTGGFTAKKLADAAEIFKEMEHDKECLKFLSFPADIISTGTYRINTVCVTVVYLLKYCSINLMVSR